MVGRVTKAVRDAFDPDGMQLLQNNGVGGFQSVPHVHMHVIPFRQGHSWPPAEPAPIVPADKRVEQAEVLREALRAALG